MCRQKIIEKVIYLTFCLIFVHIAIRGELNKIHGFLLKKPRAEQLFSWLFGSFTLL